jgi:hypothetical protein
MTRAFVLLAVAAAVSVTSCRTKPEVSVRATSALSYRELIDKSPIIVVGKVAAVKVVGSEVRTTDEHRYPLRLQRVTIQAENVLKGEVRSGEMVFYRYGWSPDEPMVGPWGILVPGQRNVFFLDRGDGALRSTVDLYPSHIEVRSGEHAGYTPRATQTLGESIAELLLTPAADAGPEAFSQALQIASAVSIELIGYDGTLRLMKPLLASDEPLLKRRACSVMKERFPGQVQCDVM